MKCPKCGYLGFEAVDRCRNCGYDFSLSPSLALPELPMRDPPAEPNPLGDLALIDEEPFAPPSIPSSSVGRDLDRSMAAAASENVTELPLFGDEEDDEPLIRAARPPRPPLAVRRATPEVPRLRTSHAPPRTAMLDFSPERANGNAPPEFSAAGARAVEGGRPAHENGEEPAAMGARLLAAVVDLVILAITDLVVIYFTMQICGLDLADIAILPVGPLVAFLIVQNGGYLVAFTAGGQTLGKMMAGIKVVPAQADAAVDTGQALLRTLVWVALAVPAGLGFLTAFTSSDRRGLHDRVAGTRVVRAA